MSTLVLRLGGVLQSWGVSSQYVTRDTASEPTKSGVLGLLAAAEGRRRTDPIEDLLSLRLAVRTERAGRLLRDFHTMSKTTGDRRLPTADGGKLKVGTTKVSERYYLEDALFLVFLEGTETLLAGLADAIRRPHYPLALGRRSCPPAGRVFMDLTDQSAEQCLHEWPWAVGSSERRRHRGATVTLAYSIDDPKGSHRAHDLPLSWDPQNRQFGWRSVTRGVVHVPNPDAADVAVGHDPFELLG